jgi:hypothetical protein
MIVELITALYALATSSTSGSSSSVTFSKVIASSASGFDTINSDNFICQENGIYWFFLTAVFSGTGNKANVSLIGTDPQFITPQVIRLHSTFPNIDTMSRDFVRNLIAGQEISISSQFPLYSDGDMTGSSLGLFRIDNLMSPLVSYTILY